MQAAPWTPPFFWARGKSLINVYRSGWSSRQCKTSTDLNPRRERGVLFERIPRPRHTVNLTSGPFNEFWPLLEVLVEHNAPSTWDQSWSDPLLAARKSAPTVTGDHCLMSDAPGVSSGGGRGASRSQAAPARAPPPLLLASLLHKRRWRLATPPGLASPWLLPGPGHGCLKF